MKTLLTSGKPGERGGSLIVLCLVMVTVVTVLGGVAAFVAQSSKVTRSRSNMISAIQYAQAAAVIGAYDLDTALGQTVGKLSDNLKNGANKYSTVSNLTYQRTITAPFSNQTATATITLPNDSSASSARIVGSATVRGVTQTATVNLKMSWGFPAAIINTGKGTTSTANTKASGIAGNVAIDGDKTGPLVVDGGSGLAILSNSRINIDTNYLRPPASAYSQTNWGTANQIPDYTAQGTSNSLFDINRFIAVADLTTNGPSPWKKSNHFTNMATFVTAMQKYTNEYTSAMKGVIVVDVSYTEAVSQKTPVNFDVATFPNGINIQGTLLLNFSGTGWDPTTERFMVYCDLNINAATNMNSLVATNPSTYTTGYPATYAGTNSTRNPINIDITSKGFQNFTAADDLPAAIYSTGVLDIHGNCNICGVLYTPCYVEIENLYNAQLQYIKGCIIMGGGLFYQNTHTGTSIISYDGNALDALATYGTAGKKVFVTYWEP